jgi:hypothetical protein
MKRFTMAIFLLIFLIGACATVPKTALTPTDLSFLKGEWEGSRSMMWGRERSFDFTEMEIFNDSVPLKGKITIKIPIAFLGETDTRSYSFENGFIDPEGDLSIQLTDVTFLKLSLYKGGKGIKLEGNYNHRGNTGIVKLYRK